MARQGTEVIGACIRRQTATPGLGNSQAGGLYRGSRIQKPGA